MKQVKFKNLFAYLDEFSGALKELHFNGLPKYVQQIQNNNSRGYGQQQQQQPLFIDIKPQKFNQWKKILSQVTQMSLEQFRIESSIMIAFDHIYVNLKQLDIKDSQVYDQGTFDSYITSKIELQQQLFSQLKSLTISKSQIQLKKFHDIISRNSKQQLPFAKLDKAILEVRICNDSDEYECYLRPFLIPNALIKDYVSEFTIKRIFFILSQLSEVPYQNSTVTLHCSKLAIKSMLECNLFDPIGMIQAQLDSYGSGHTIESITDEREPSCCTIFNFACSEGKRLRVIFDRHVQGALLSIK
ncbi:hypothetical protein FGO68_gene3787 [Halteria grandinella]|uniref:Uncharacterized protein n=1 Tax=Halteria grandinella TaxID=5974 RepID=A0A8J8T3K4_HALGN|nr:hypothetical protein FGO68_gene3787 [Halteria grandinella]